MNENETENSETLEIPFEEIPPELISKLVEQNYGQQIGGVIADPPEVRLRNMIITGAVDEDMAAGITKNLLSMNAEDPDTPIVMFLNTYGGSVHDMLAIYDIMKFVDAPIYTVGFGKIMSAGVLILAAGEPGHRYALPHTSIMMHRLRGIGAGTVADIDSSRNHMDHLQRTSENLIVKHSKLTKKQLKDYMKGSDSYLTANQAKKIGIIDHVSAILPRTLK